MDPKRSSEEGSNLFNDSLPLINGISRHQWSQSISVCCEQNAPVCTQAFTYCCEIGFAYVSVTTLRSLHNQSEAVTNPKTPTHTAIHWVIPTISANIRLLSLPETSSKTQHINTPIASEHNGLSHLPLISQHSQHVHISSRLWSKQQQWIKKSEWHSFPWGNVISS